MPNTTQPEKDKYFISCLRNHLCIYIIGLIGVVAHVVASVFIILDLTDKSTTTDGKAYSYIGVVMLLGTAISELFMLRAVKQRLLFFIQMWMSFTFLLVMVSMLLTVVFGFTILPRGLWIMSSFAFLVIRLPLQMYFVDRFTHSEILHQDDYTNNVPYKRHS